MIHQSVKIGKHCIIGEDVHIGAGTVVMPFCEIRNGARIGKNCYIDSRVTMTGKCSIGDGVTIRNACIIARGSVIEDEAFLCPQVMFNNLNTEKEKIGGAKVGRRAFIGTNTTLHHGVTVAPGAIVGAKSFVNKDIGRGLWVGVPVKKVDK